MWVQKFSPAHFLVGCGLAHFTILKKKANKFFFTYLLLFFFGLGEKKNKKKG